MVRRTGSDRIVAKSARETLRPETGTPPPSKRSRYARNRFVVFLNFVLSCVIFLVILAGVLFYIGKLQFERPGPSTTAETIMIPPRTGVRAIADLLERRGLITDARIFVVGLRIHDADSAIKAGEYEIKAHASMQDIMELLESGRSVLYSLTIPEGETVAQAFERIANMPQLSGELPEELPPEGSLATNTFRFTRGTSREDVVNRLMEEQKQIVSSAWERRADDLPIDSVEEFITLASIVEKETGVPDERSRVAAVFLNRLERGMRMQSDPTVIYGLFGGEGKPSDRPIYRSDLEKETPYNTYIIDGLPPTPIANPGKASLEAVANPSRTDDLYFVADGTGGHAFATTLDEHNQNVARWRRIELERRTQQEQEAAEGAEEAEDSE
ncbi:endolytic transglycosylase MltG [Chelativorans sp. YIM 93263]|uniref:endolytic transglycosylase MltG n=1 Tax=Chelativorans sp. YIM 93263 TaxID=2906648 RepID=UPI002377FCB7|nr:endolytic transglycosylase MltG [Chelativorans sp. YIM 93263]